MKKFGCTMLAMLMCFGMFAGCGSFDSDETIISVGKKGTIETIDVEPFDKSYYTEDDFKAFAKEAIDAYNLSHEVDSVELTEFTVSENEAKLKMKFKTAADYSNFQDVFLYHGTVAEAVEEGYDFQVSFSTVENGEITLAALPSEVLEQEKLNVVIVQSDMKLKLPGKICYVSGQNAVLTAKDIVSIEDGGDTLEASKVPYTYIIYK